MKLKLVQEIQIGDDQEKALTSRLLHAIGLGWYARYARSKLCNVMFAAELRRKYPAGPLSVAVSPGLVNIGIFRSVPDPLGQVVRWLASKSFQSPAEGAQHVMRAISAAQEAQHSGDKSLLSEHFPLYWHCSKPQELSNVIYALGLLNFKAGKSQAVRFGSLLEEGHGSRTDRDIHFDRPSRGFLAMMTIWHCYGFAPL